VEAAARLARSVAEVEAALHTAERAIEADARARIQALRKDAVKQLAVVHEYTREASSLLSRLSTASSCSWGDLERAADAVLSQARAVADAMVERIRGAVVDDGDERCH